MHVSKCHQSNQQNNKIYNKVNKVKNEYWSLVRKSLVNRKWDQKQSKSIPKYRSCQKVVQCGVHNKTVKTNFTTWKLAWLQLHGAIYRPDSFLLLRYSGNLKAIRYESTSLNRVVADKSHRAIAAYIMADFKTSFIYCTSRNDQNSKNSIFCIVLGDLATII